MNEKTLRALEFHKIADMLTGCAVSTMGKKMASGIAPSGDIAEIEHRQSETAHAYGIIVKKGPPPLGGLKDIEPSVKRAAVGGVLSIEELLAIGDFLHVCRKMKNYHSEDGEPAPGALDSSFAAITVPAPLEKEIARCVLGPFDIADDASPALKDVRRNIKISNERIKEQLNSVVHSSAYRNMLQDSVITIRGDRYCVPVKAEFRNAFPGMVHDQSGTGVTLFMEPMSVVRLNNQIKELIAKEKAEVLKVLGKLSAQTAEYADELVYSAQALTHLDFVFAKGNLALDMKASRPVLNTGGAVHFKKARHPLLNPNTVVPTDIYLGDGFTTLLITGPNTGGKTVALKTLGLLSLMSQAGLHIPAFDGSKAAVFGQIFADIGDEQSIEQSLSTFSSHMTNIVDILDNASENSLVLLDELGAGTDPTEGAALAIAILRSLRGCGARTAVTTHYSELKVYAISTEGAQNASCEFDVATLRPTYRLLIGVPGKSNAFAISKRLGLSDDIIEAARQTISADTARFEDVLTDLEISRKAVEAERERAEAFRAEAEAFRAEAQTQKQRFAAAREKLLQSARQEALAITRNAKEEADALFKQFQKQLREAPLKEAEATRAAISLKVNAMQQDMEPADAPPQACVDPKRLAKGDRVFIRSLNQPGVVATLPDAAGLLFVTSGIMKIKVRASDLSPDTAKEPAPAANAPAISARAAKSMSICPELDLRGHTVSEALEKTDKYLDDAYLSSVGRVSIIHGKGTGALRQAVSNYLRTHPLVKSFRLGVHGEGDSGVTVVELKKD